MIEPIRYYTCVYCGEVRSTQGLLDDHLRNRHDRSKADPIQTTWDCKLCGEYGFLRADYAAHMLMEHPGAISINDLRREFGYLNLKDSKPDDVNHPSHYTAYKGLEIIDLTEQMNFNRGNAVKYTARAGLKNPDDEVKDLKKAIWYLEREIKRISNADLPTVSGV